MERLALELASQRLFMAPPTVIVNIMPNLCPNECRAPSTGRAYPVVDAMKAPSGVLALQFVQDIIRNPTPARQWSDEVR